jgi:large subunit ribosomal protein L30
MPEKKAQTEKVKTISTEKPAVKKTVAKTTTAVAKPKVVSAKVTATKAPAVKATATKVPAAKAKVAVAAKPETVEVKTPKVVEEPKAVEQPKVVTEVTKPAAKPEPKKVIKGKVLKITLVKSGIGYSKRHKKTLKALGFRHLHQTIEQADSPSIRGMLALVAHLVVIEEQGTK